MLSELDVVVFLKAHESIDRVAERVFGSLRTPYQLTQPEEGADEGTYYEASGLGFQAQLFANTGDVLDPEFEAYPFGLEITSSFWCVELDAADLEGPLSEYFARKLAFDLDLETATELLLETTAESEILEIRAFRRNTQFRFDQAPTVPKVFIVESRQVEEAFDDKFFEIHDGEETEDREAEDRV